MEPQKVVVLGSDGYLGWNLSMYLADKGYEVAGCDNFLRRRLVKEVGEESLTPIKGMPERIQAFKEVFGIELTFEYGDLLDYGFIRHFLKKHKPDVIVDFAEIPCAPYSMKSVETATLTQKNNVIGTLNLLWAMKETCPEAHLIKLGTLGEYGTPNIDIPEGYFEIEYHGRKDRLPFPKQAGSWYHLTKVHDTNNIAFACRVWKFRSTDLMQGPVYGVYIPQSRKDPRLLSRLDYGGCWGTVMNRYCVEAICGYPLTPYGRGGQKRGFIYIEDTMRCIELCIENPPELGVHRVFNQFFELWTVKDLAYKVKEVCEKYFNIKVEVNPIENPRVEAEEHYYNPSNEGLLNLGIKPHLIDDTLPIFIKDLLPFKNRVKKEIIYPTIKWR